MLRNTQAIAGLLKIFLYSHISGGQNSNLFSIIGNSSVTTKNETTEVA
jgi:hypothetical protein